jgi:hypothetical protein
MTARKRPYPIDELAEDGLLRDSVVEVLVTAMGIEYLFKMPETVPPEQILVHNHVRPQSRLGENGFRAWLHGPNPDLDRHEVCDCGWAAQFPEHYRVIRN